MGKIAKYLVAVLLLLIFISAAIFLLHKSKKNQLAGKAIPFVLSEMQNFDFPPNVCNISDYGAISDGITSNTEAIKKSIQDCVQKGGGKVVIPAGKWLTGAIHLASNIDLDLDKDAEIIFSANPKDYLPAVFTRIEGIELYNYSPFIYANGAENVAITGRGKLNGQGQLWQTWKKGEKPALEKLNKMVKDNLPVEKRIFGTSEDALRPSFVQFVNCKNVRLEGYSITNSPRWTIHLIYSENVVLRNLDVDTLGFNSDGVVIDSSKNILVENSRLLSSDDTISIKSGLNEDGWRVNRPSENIVIRNCAIEGGHSAIAIGSEMSGGVRNVLLENLRLNGVDQGIRAKSVKNRGGFVENVWAKNITMGDVTNTALKLDLTYPASTLNSEGGKAPVFKNFYFDGISVGKTKYAVELEGLESSLISNVNISNLTATAEKGISVKYSQDVNFDQMEIEGVKKPPIFSVSNSQNINY
ncbi:MAG: glycoside hydrolase family 28 protein [Parcubacteria group bacterium]|jgi:polygalacturonase